MDPDLAGALRPEQRVSAKSLPLPRRHLTPGVLALLIVLRVLIFVSIPIVIYAFVHALQTPQ